MLQARLHGIPRFTPRRTRIHGWDLSIPDAASFLSTYREIFVKRIYAFSSTTDVPKILDLGANIGLSVLFFKQLYPKADITALEADPGIFRHLVENVHGNGFVDVRLINKAVWDENSTISFSVQGADGGRAALVGDENLIEVEAIGIAELLRDSPVDFLKMDIEGAEEYVLPACKEFLSDIRYIFIEYHSKPKTKQCLDNMLGILADAGFRVHIQSPILSSSPFVGVTAEHGFDQQLNIFGWKEK